MIAELVIVLSVVAGAIAQAITGLGFALVCAPFFITTLGPREGVRLVVLLSAILNAAVVARDHEGLDWRAGALLLAPAAAVTPLAVIATADVDADVLAAVAGATIVLAAAVLAVGVQLDRAGGRAGAVVAGSISAVLNVIAGVSGPPVALYALNAGWPQRSLRSTLQVYFLGVNLVALVSLGLPSLTPLPFAALALGLVVGALVAGRVPDGVARSGTLVIAAAGGLATLIARIPT